MNYFNHACWQALWGAAELKGQSKKWFDEVVARYSEPQRYYHTAKHIDNCLADFQSVKSDPFNAVAVEFAIWFHDAVYDPRRTDNEEQSARVAMDCLKGAEPSLGQTVSELIHKTKQHIPDGNGDSALLIDIDLAILGKPPPEFEGYERGIRKEYEWVEPDVYSKSRAAILEGFLARPRIYRTSWFHNQYEEQARVNLARSIAQLRK